MYPFWTPNDVELDAGHVAAAIGQMGHGFWPMKKPPPQAFTAPYWISEPDRMEIMLKDELESS